MNERVTYQHTLTKYLLEVMELFMSEHIMYHKAETKYLLQIHYNIKSNLIKAMS